MTDKIIHHTSKYGGEYRLKVGHRRYTNGQTKLQLFDMEDGFPYCTATIALEDVTLQEDEVAIKNYSENEGILQSLIKADIIEAPHTFIHSGYVKIPVCKLKTFPTTSA
jgi:hypothetical protein